MSEAIANKDPALKLFGQTIQLPHSSAGIDEETHKDQCDDDGKEEKEPLTADELHDQNPILEKGDIIKESLPCNDCSTPKTAKSEEEQGETTNSQEKILKKPDKIIPCPRCNSMETKFCYFNNYNVNQPRHFCKNCQRYWTAGGNMRNMPVGSGRRKHKNSVFQYRHPSVPEASLTFDTENPLSGSNVSVFNVANKTMQNCSGNGFRKYEELRVPVCFEAGDNGDEHSDVSSVTAASSKDCDNKGGRPDMQRHNFNNLPPHIPYYTGVPWSYAVPPPGYYLPGFPMPFYPAPSFWNVPWMYPAIASENQMPSTSGTDSPTLGKRSRDESLLESTGSEEEPQRKSNSEKCLWFPKTSRMDDPGEAAKNSIWATMGIKHDAVDSVSGGLLKAFLPKSDETDRGSENSSVLQANPAAMSRSLKFKESS